VTPDLVLLGNLLVDDIVLRDGRTLMGEPGGAMIYASLSARLWGLSVGLATVAGEDYPRAMLDALEERGVGLAGVRPLGRPGVRTWLLYERSVRRVIHQLGCPSHLEVSPSLADLPDTYLGARAFHLAPMPIDRQRELVQGLGNRAAFVSLDPHEAVRADNLEAWRSCLDLADAFFPSEDELLLPEGDANPSEWLGRIPGARLRFTVLKRGARGGLLHDRRHGRLVSWGARAGRVVDPTGAGDAFAGGFLAGWLASEDLDRALQQGIVSASFAIADWGPRGLLAASPESAERRRREWFEPAGASERAWHTVSDA